MGLQDAEPVAIDGAEKAQRLRAIELLEQGTGCTELAETVGISRQTAYRWKRVFDEGGVEALIEMRHVGRPPSLSDSQCIELRAALSRSPAEYGMGSGPWALKRVSKFIHRQFGIQQSESNVSRILIGLGASIKDVRQRTDGPSQSPGIPR